MQAAPPQAKPLTAAEIQRTAREFLAAWAKGDSAAAGALTTAGSSSYRDDVAASGVVLQGGHGGDSAGPIVAKVLAASEG